jgi:putative flippase GtrA
LVNVSDGAFDDVLDAELGDVPQDRPGHVDVPEQGQSQPEQGRGNGSDAPVPQAGSDKSQMLRQFIRFGLVGGSGVLVNAVVMVLMHKLHGGPEFADQPIFNLPGTDFWVRYRNVVFIVSFIVANVWNYQLNRRHTFEKTGRSWLRDFGPFFCTGILGAIIGLACQIALTHPDLPTYLPDPPFTATGTLLSRELWAQLIGVAISTPITFGLNRVWAFRTDKTTNSDTDAEVGVGVEQEVGV